jgi:ATP-dependent Lon protease
MVFAFMEGELGVLQVEKKIRGRVKRQMEKTQREYYLNEQLKAIQRELGGAEGEEADEMAELQAKIDKLKMSKEAKAKANAELKKLKSMQPMSAEATVVRNYLDVLLGLPWGKRSKVKNDLKRAQEILDDDHFALEKVKDRIVEYLAVQARTNKLKGPILCLVGPPGVGKTSLGKSIAKATGREFVRQSLGGVRDEAEIRGHRRTYIGSLPGKIVSNLKKAGQHEPAVPARRDRQAGAGFPGRSGFGAARSARSRTERQVPGPLSGNRPRSLGRDVRHHREQLNLPQPLARPHGDHPAGRLYRGREGRDRTAPPGAKQIEAHGLKKGEFTSPTAGLRDLIRYYTREAGVRTLEREIARLARKALRKILEGKREVRGDYA